MLLAFKSGKFVITGFLNSRMFSWCVFMVLLALIRSCVWFCFNFVCLLPFLIFLFICRGGWGGKPQCFTLLTEFWQLSCFITLQKLLLRVKLFFLSIDSNENYNNLYCSFLLLLYYFLFKFNITLFYICYCFLLLLSFIHIVYYFQMDCFEALFSFAS